MDITGVKLLGMRSDGGEYIRMSKRLFASAVVGAMLVISAVLVVSLIGGDDKPDITNDVPQEDEQLPDDSQDDTPVETTRQIATRPTPRPLPMMSRRATTPRTRTRRTMTPRTKSLTRTTMRDRTKRRTATASAAVTATSTLRPLPGPRR